MNRKSEEFDPKQTLYLVDISSFIFRAFFAIRSLTNKKGEPTNAVYGVATMLARLVEEANPEYLAVVYDSKEPSFRKEVYTEYKANRSEAPDDLVPQFDRIEQLIRCLRIHGYRQSGVEADDLIATLAREWCELSPKHRVVVVSGDKDLMQLVNPCVKVWDTMKNQFFSEPDVVEKFGVRPDQIRDYLALIGDTSDNIPGVPSIGPKTATTLLQEHGTLDAVLAAAKAGKVSGKKGEVLKEYEKQAHLSAELATLKDDCPVELDTEYVRYRLKLGEDCFDFLREMDFHTLVTKWAKYRDGAADASASPGAPGVQGLGPLGAISGGPLSAAPAAAEGVSFRAITTEAEFAELLSRLEEKRVFGFDLETTSLNPREAKIVGLAFCLEPNEGLYVPIGHLKPETPQLPAGWVLEKLKPILESDRYQKIGQNLKYDWSVLLNQGIRPTGIFADTLIAAYLLEIDGRKSLESLADHYFDYKALSYEDVCGESGRGKTQLCFDEVSVAVATRYAAEDAWLAVRLWETMRPELEKRGLMRVFSEIEVPLVDLLARMECEGVCLDEGWMARLSSEFEKELAEIEEKISKYTSGPVNLNSPKQLATLLFEELKLPVQSKTKTGYSTDARVLDTLAPLHEVPRLLLEYREISKLKGTYVDPLPELRDAKTGKIHAGFHQAVAATGRLSSSDPNLQNIPIRTERGRKIRRGFLPSQGNMLVSADYSQIELRVLAEMSGDKELVRSFQTGEDVHQRTASEIFEVAPEQVDDRQRSIAKAINFGLMYGKSAFGLAQELKISRSEAQDIIQRYFKRYNGVKRFLDRQIDEARERGWVQTLMGRKRHLPEIRSKNPAIRNNAERMAMNSPIQGTAADLMKAAMLNLDRELARVGSRARIIIQVHDEVVLDCPRDEAKDIERLTVQVFERTRLGEHEFSVPLKANSAVGENWMDL